jgi:uncharacterized repeat protein (TIGR03803 family)
MARKQATYITIAILGRRPRAATTALVLAMVLLASAVATPSAEAQTYKILHTFTARTDGASPYAGLLRDGAGNLHGTTYHGGASDIGTVFKIDKTGTESALYSFSGCCDVYKGGASPDGGLVRDAAGSLYGIPSRAALPSLTRCRLNECFASARDLPRRHAAHRRTRWMVAMSSPM